MADVREEFCLEMNRKMKLIEATYESRMDAAGLSLRHCTISVCGSELVLETDEGDCLQFYSPAPAWANPGSRPAREEEAKRYIVDFVRGHNGSRCGKYEAEEARREFMATSPGFQVSEITEGMVS